MLLRPLTHMSRFWPTLGLTGSLQVGCYKGSPPWVCRVWTPKKGTASTLTCQCLVTAFHTPMRPVWLVAMSWFPTKNKASTGTPRWKTPVRRKEHSARPCFTGKKRDGRESSKGQRSQLAMESYRTEDSSRNYRGSPEDRDVLGNRSVNTDF